MGDKSVDKEAARPSIRLIVANQRLQSPITLKRDYYHWIGQISDEGGRDGEMRTTGVGGIDSKGNEIV